MIQSCDRCYSPTCECVLWSREARQDAVYRLVRPLEVDDIVRALRASMRARGTYDAVNHTSAFLHHNFNRGVFRWVPDPDHCDQWCSPAATLYTGEGDCDDWGLVAASILVGLGVECHVIIGTFNGEGHMWIEGRARNGSWYHLEPVHGKVSWHQRPRGYQVDYPLDTGAIRAA